MAVPAKRFGFFHDTYNLPVFDLLQGTNLGALNIDDGTINDIVSKVSGLLNKQTLPSSLSSLIPSRDTLNNESNKYSLNSNGIDNLVGKYFSTDPSMSGFIHSLDSVTKNNILSNNLSSLNGTNEITIDGITSKITSSLDVNTFSSFLDNFTKGSLGIDFKNNNDTISLLSGVCTTGYEGGIKGMFTNMTKNITDKYTLSQIGGVVVNNLVKQNNSTGINEILNSTAGTLLRSANPDLMKSITSMSNMSEPLFNTLASMGEGLLGSPGHLTSKNITNPQSTDTVKWSIVRGTTNSVSDVTKNTSTLTDHEAVIMCSADDNKASSLYSNII